MTELVSRGWGHTAEHLAMNSRRLGKAVETLGSLSDALTTLGLSATPSQERMPRFTDLWMLRQ